MKKYNEYNNEKGGMMKKGRMLNNQSIEMYNEAKAAYDKAEKAKKDADDTAKEAIETLRILQVCGQGCEIFFGKQLFFNLNRR